MCGMGLPGRGIGHELGVAVVGSDEGDATRAFHGSVTYA